jgi:hypothetical protein
MGYLSAARVAAALGLGGAAAGALFPGQARGQAQAPSEFPLARKLVWINMGGGWDILESVDPKASSTKDLDVGYDYALTHVLAGSGGTHVGRYFPGLATQGDDVLLLRGLAMGTTSHDAGAVYMDTGILSNAGRVNAASIPSIVASESDATIPIIQLAGGMEPQLDRGLLKPVSLVRAQNLDLYRSMYPTEKAEVARKMAMLDYMRKSVARAKAKMGANDRLGAVEAAESKIRGQIASGIGAKLQLTAADRAAFASAAVQGMGGGVADAFALALKLIKNDLVSCVNMGMGGFDTHANQERQLSAILPPFDAALTTFIKELRKAGKLDTTLIVLYSDFGRTPKINGGNGRDHWPVGGAMMIGGGIDGGRAVGGTTADLLAMDFNPDNGAAVREGGGQQLTPKHLGAAVLRLCMADEYLGYRTYFSSEEGVDSDSLVRLKA